MTSIEQIFVALVAALKNMNIEYCICGNYINLPYHTDNDIDIWVEDHVGALKILKEVANSQGYKIYISNVTANGSNNFLHKRVGSSFETVHIDLMTECSWMSIIPLIPGPMFRTSVATFRGFNIANDQLDAAMHFLYPLISFGTVKGKYHADIRQQCGTTLFRNALKYALGEKQSELLVTLIDREEWDTIVSMVAVLRRIVLRRALGRHMSIKRIHIFGAFVTSVIRRLFRPTGLSLAFIGPDGAGKTTIIDHIGRRMAALCPRNMFRQMYWRPFFLPELNKIVHLRKPVDVNYHNTDYFFYRQRHVKAGGVRSFSYHAKFLYYWLDYIVGSVKIVAITSRGGVVCFDRYYDDQFVYPQRFGFLVSRNLMEFMGRFIYRPNLMFVLCPSSETILSRKQEMPTEEVHRQVDEYRQLASNCNYILVDGTGSISVTVDCIIMTCLEYLSERNVRHR